MTRTFNFLSAVVTDKQDPSGFDEAVARAASADTILGKRKVEIVTTTPTTQTTQTRTVEKER